MCALPRLGQPTPSATTQPPRPLLARGCAPKALQENSFASTPALPTHRLPRARCATPPLLRRTPRRQCRLEQVTTHRLPEPHRHTSVATPPRRGSTARQPPMRRPRAELTVQALEVDHVVQCYLGGSGEPGNLRLVCPACHRERTQAQAQAARRWTFSLTNRRQRTEVAPTSRYTSKTALMHLHSQCLPSAPEVKTLFGAISCNGWAFRRRAKKRKTGLGSKCKTNGSSGKP